MQHPVCLIRVRSTVNHNRDKYKKQLQKIGEGSRDGNTKKYSNKGGRDDKYNRHPPTLHTHAYWHHTTQSSPICGATVSM